MYLYDTNFPDPAPGTPTEYSYAEGTSYSYDTNSHAEGQGTAAGASSHAEGYGTAIGSYSHAEGTGTAQGIASHAEGSNTKALGFYSHAEGGDGTAIGDYSHAGGYFTIASGSAQQAIGKYNKRNNDFSLLVVGNGVDDPDADRSDILRVNQSSVEVTGSFILSGSFKSPIGTDFPFGTATLDGGTPGSVVVSNSLATSDSIIMLTKQTFGTPAGVVGISAKSGGSFTITSSENSDADTVAYFIVNPA